MKKYETAEFRADESGIALLRSRFAYRSFAYEDISELTIRKGKVVKNPAVVLIMGVLLILAGFYISNYYSPLNIFDSDQIDIKGGKAIGYLIFMVLGLFCFGGILVYNALKKDFVLVIKAGNFSKSLPLTELRKRNELNSFIRELQKITDKKLIVSTRELVLG